MIDLQAGEEADGFVTSGLDVTAIRDKLFPALKEGVAISRKDYSSDYSSIEKILFIPASHHEDKEKASESIRFWRSRSKKKFKKLVRS